MEKNQNDPAMHNPSEALRGESLNYKGAENSISAEDDEKQIHQKEKEIDPGNEHKHNENNNANRSSNQDADAGGDAIGTAGPKPK